VLEAFIRYFDKCEHKIPLVLADYPEALVNLILTTHARMDLKEYVHRLDYIVNSDLPAIYSMAEIFLYPSLRESFGIPLLEAMSCGTPVISSSVFAMPEVAEGAAYLVDPLNPDDIAAAIHTLMRDSKLRESYIEKGFLQSKKFSWQKMATQVIDLYKEVLADTKT
jgi:glycosyltransferase involved in cell wall biosynthesis